MKIFSFQIGYGVEVKDHISLNIYLSGCKNNKKCEKGKCHNPILRSFKVGDYYFLKLPELDKLTEEEKMNIKNYIYEIKSKESLNEYLRNLRLKAKIKVNPFIE